ncbi:MAG: class II aldolase/adducin family protein [Devosia sp.]
MSHIDQNHDFQSEFVALVNLSARIGVDRLTTQGAGGNTSLKVGDVMWIKASGTWLSEAASRDIMVPVQFRKLLEAVEQDTPAAEQAHVFVDQALSSTGLRPSIETSVHALLPQKVVLHVHCVDTISIAVQTNAVAVLGKLLDGLNWRFVPYARPGLPLAHQIARQLDGRPDVLVLGNHGLVVAGETVAEADALLHTVQSRLRRTTRFATPMPDIDFLPPEGYVLPTLAQAHWLAFDDIALGIATTGVLYPDHVVFLGAHCTLVPPGAPEAALNARTAPQWKILAGRGVVLRQDLAVGAHEMARCFAEVLARVPAGAELRYLGDDECAELLGWDAEKYRQRLNAAEAQPQK